MNTPTIAHNAIRPEAPNLIRLTDGEWFLTTKMEATAYALRVHGIFLAPAEGKPFDVAISIRKEHQDIFANASADDHFAMEFPWHRVLSVMNLVYRHKGTKPQSQGS